MRLSTSVCIFFLLAGSTWGQEAMSPWTAQAKQGGIQLSEDFCDVCDCCRVADSWTESVAATPTPPPQVQIFSNDAFESLKFLHENLGPGSSQILSPLMEGARLEGIVDFCDACQCCAQQPAGLEVSPPSQWSEELYGRFDILAR